MNGDKKIKLVLIVTQVVTVMFGSLVVTRFIL